MIVAAQARATARQMIKERGKLMVGVTFAYFGFSIAIGLLSIPFNMSPSASLVWSIAVMFLTYPLALGLMHVNNMIYYRRECSLGNMFDFFRNYRVALRVIGVVLIFVSSLFVFLLLFVSLSAVTLIPMLYGSPTAGGGVVFMMILMVLLCIALGVVLGSMQMACCYVALRNRSISFGTLLSNSIKVGWTYAWRYFCLTFSFTGWILLGSAILLVPMTILIFGADIAAGIIAVLIVCTILFITYMAFLGIYVYAADSVFFNCAIDEYELRHPDYAGSTPYVPEAPAPAAEHHTPSLELTSPRPEPAAQSPEPPIIPPPITELPVSENPPLSPLSDVPPVIDVMPVEAPLAPPETATVSPSNERCDVILTDAGLTKLTLAQLVQELSAMSLSDAQAMVEKAPVTLLVGAERTEAEKIATRLRDAGATVELK